MSDFGTALDPAVRLVLRGSDERACVRLDDLSFTPEVGAQIQVYSVSDALIGPARVVSVDTEDGLVTVLVLLDEQMPTAGEAHS